MNTNLEDINKIECLVASGLSSLKLGTNITAGDIGLMLELSALAFESAAKRTRSLHRKLLKQIQKSVKLAK